MLLLANLDNKWPTERTGADKCDGHLGHQSQALDMLQKGRCLIADAGDDAYLARRHCREADGAGGVLPIDGLSMRTGFRVTEKAVETRFHLIRDVRRDVADRIIHLVPRKGENVAEQPLQ